MAWVISDETMQRVRDLVFGSDYIPSVLGDIVNEGERVLASLVWTTEDWAWQVETWENYEHKLTVEQRAEVMKVLADVWGDFEHEYVVEQVNDQLQEIVNDVITQVINEEAEDVD